MSNSIAYLITDRNVSLTLDGKPHIIPSSAGVYDQVIDAIRRDDLNELRNLMKPKQQIATATEGRITFDGRDLYFNGEVIHNAVKDRLHHLWSAGLNYQPLLRFLDNLMDNPSYRAVKETYRFLEACNLPITNDGHFLAYKMVRSNFTDIFSGKMDNSIGAEVKVPRNEVDEDSNRTCSRGLHACSQEYLGCYGSASRNDRIVVVKINPCDVVAVPQDYNNAKMRVCRYEVVDELSWDDVRVDEFHTDNYGGVDPSVEADDSFDDLPQGDSSGDTTTQPYVGNGSPVGTPKLTEKQVQDIKRMLVSADYTISAIAALYNVNESTIRKIRDGQTWRNVVI